MCTPLLLCEGIEIWPQILIRHDLMSYQKLFDVFHGSDHEFSQEGYKPESVLITWFCSMYVETSSSMTVALQFICWCWLCWGLALFESRDAPKLSNLEGEWTHVNCRVERFQSSYCNNQETLNGSVISRFLTNKSAVNNDKGQIERLIGHNVLRLRTCSKCKKGIISWYDCLALR